MPAPTVRLLGQWWWTVNRWTLAAVIALMFVGAILVLAASPAVATRIGLDSFYLVRHHYMMLPAAAAVLIAVSVLTPRQVRRLGVVLFFFFLALTAMTLGRPAWRSRAPRAGSRSVRSRCSRPSS